MAPKLGAVDPSRHPDEDFDLYSVPAFDNAEPDVVPGASIGSQKQIVRSGDVLLCRIVPHIRRAWVVGGVRGRRLIASGEWIVFRSERAHPPYLRHVLVSDHFHAQFMNTIAGVGGSLLRARPTFVAKIGIPLPSITEQRRIAEVLDRAEDLRAKRRAALEHVETLKQSIFLDMFGDPDTNPREWAVRPVSDYVERFITGKSLGSSGDDGLTKNRVLKVSAVKNGRFVPQESKPVSDAYYPPAQHFVTTGDLLFSRANVAELVGDVALVKKTSPNLLVPDKLWRFVWREPRLALPQFVWDSLSDTCYPTRIRARRHRHERIDEEHFAEEGSCSVHHPASSCTARGVCETTRIRGEVRRTSRYL